MKENVLSCIQPTSEMHIGNYFGAIRNWVDLQDNYNCFFGVVDYHAMTMPYDPEVLRNNTFRMVVDLLACGVDPEKAHIFVQSLVPEHTELAWILGCFCAYGELSRQTQFKEKSDSDKLKSDGNIISTGLFTYPVLQAADILIYKPKFVPVGKDQEQHLELSRNIAIRFNNKHGEYFPEPEVLFTETPKIQSLADPSKKMSKSAGPVHYVSLFEEPEALIKKVKTAVTDSGNTPAGEMSQGVSNMFTLLKACQSNAYNGLMDDYNAGALRYVNLKQAVTDALSGLIEPLRARRAELLQDEKRLTELIYDKSAQTRKVAQEHLREIRELTGLFRF
jgi:tryptophanyl-tRNA synthetase